ncbi:HD domain-containing phosphohydrolase [Azospira inquinata]|uniref:Response regulator n=1 Tax=Azospira inquinata TaxID=2785627 RepID=A0A975XV65_9RHOO|nr:HD domain-containing phosphohydrolase [Azospira inquinata]QWT45182.1 response regulator [Azospira inquinata]QWT49485.1 response regulator [Azospira inquinata]
MLLNIVIVDDAEINLALFKALAGRIPETRIWCFPRSGEALTWCAEGQADMVVVDYMMPAPDGLEFIRRFRAMPGMETVPLLMVTANEQREVRYQALEAGASDFLTKPVDKAEFLARLRNLCELRRSQRLLHDRAAWLAEEVAKATASLVTREQETIICLAKAAEYRDPETGAHILRMARYARLIGRHLGLDEAALELLLAAAPMHDVGKVGIPDHILLKPGRLDPDEFRIMQRHAALGHDILSQGRSPLLQAAAEIAHSHHEKFDGSGYPQGLAGEAIPLFGRITAVADVFDALTSVRPYKPAWPLEKAVALLKEGAGSHFDPRCVNAFLDDWGAVLTIRDQYGDRPEPEADKDNPS